MMRSPHRDLDAATGCLNALLIAALFWATVVLGLVVIL